MTATLNANAPDVVATQFAPYLYFYGRCEEALAFYKTAFGGDYEICVRFGDVPAACNVAAEFADKVCHATFTAPGLTFLASDGSTPRELDAEAGNIALGITVPSHETGDRVFRALAEGGTIVQPFGDAFWGGKFGIVQDRFATEWVINSPNA